MLIGANAAMLVNLSGRDVVAHYGSAAAEIAVCTKAVGLVERSELRLLEVVGAEAPLNHVLASAIPGEVPGPGRARCVAATWCCRVAPNRAIVAGAAGAVDRWRQVMRRAAATTGIAVTAGSLPDGEAESIVGPKASAVLRSSSLPSDLAPGAVAEGQIAGSPVSVVCEEPDRYLLLFAQGRSAAALETIGDCGGPFGLARVGHEALAHLRAAQRDNG